LVISSTLFPILERISASKGFISIQRACSIDIAAQRY